MKLDVKLIVKILVVIIVVAIIVFGIVLLSKKEKPNNQEKEEINKRVITKIEYTAPKKENNNSYIAVIYNDGEILKTANDKEEKSQLSKEDTDKLLELIDKVDVNNYSQINTFLPLESGFVIKIYTSNNEEKLIKDFYSTNKSEAGIEIFKILENNNLIKQMQFYR